MEKQYKKVIFFLAIIYAFLPIYTASASQDLTKNEQFFFDLINMTREKPLDVVEAFGMDKKKVLEDNPKLRKILKDGLPPLLINNKLQKASAKHSLDMLENSYLSHESLDGRTVQDRIEESGYDALICAERLNMTTFRNFIPSETALLNMFESMFKDELDPTFAGDRCILNPWFKEAGVGLASGKFDIQGKSRNAYIINVDFALSALYKIERQLFRLFNGFRANPLVTMQQVDISEDKAKEIANQN
ncbi:MAG TPA: CAP domain-containing protein, partial [Desulfohalobiaceae bacterium]|nr:CAP domain-containing protein [Desulfohalobiaceae bacterium]